MKVLPPVAIKSGNIQLSGAISKKSVTASMPATFEVDTKAAGMGEVGVVVNSASGKSVKPILNHVGNGKYVISFVPEELGAYKSVESI